MKQYILVAASSILSALLAVYIYRSFEEPQQVIIREPSPATYATLGQDPLSDIPMRTFLSSAPTDFIASAESDRKSTRLNSSHYS